MKTTTPILLLSAVLLAAAPAGAVRVQFDDANVRPGDVVVPKAETHEGDLGAKGSLTVKGTVTGDCAAFGGPLTVDGRCGGDASAFAGTATVRGLVGGDLSAFGSPVDVSGRISGDLSSIGGNVTLRSSATVMGDLSVIGGRLKREPGATVHGDVHDMSAAQWSRFGAEVAKLAVSRASRDDEKEEKRREYAVSGFFLALCLLPVLAALFFPEKIEAVGAAAAADFWRSAGIGVLVLMGFGPGLLALTVSVIGIPFVPVALLVLAAAVALSLGAFYRFLSQRAWRNLGRPEPGTIPSVALGAGVTLALGLLLSFIPGFGGFLRLCLSMTLFAAAAVGLGACWTTRLGTRPQA